MCGFFGYISSDIKLRERLNNSIDLLRHRGPDYQKSEVLKYNDYDIGLVHARLKIIDLDDRSNQPYEADGDLIVYNGEIYNYIEIKKELISKGVNFSTSSDTEVIIKAYHFWGIDKTLEKINGMFAFAIVDMTKGKFILSRDRVGIKPLYYYYDKNEFAFSSEIKPIYEFIGGERISLNLNSIAMFFAHRYVPEPDTPFENIFALDAGCYLEYDFRNKSIKQKRYWKLEKKFDYGFDQENEVLKILDEKLHSSVKNHLISDVPISFVFSGGLDSSLICAIAKEYIDDLTGYTITRKNWVKHTDIDAEYSIKIAKYLNINHRLYDIGEFASLSQFKEYRLMDSPIANSALFGLYFVFNKISKDFKVSISGNGGDEIFGGYTWYLHFLNKKVRFLKNYHKFKKKSLVDLIYYFLWEIGIYLTKSELTRYVQYTLFPRYTNKELLKMFDLNNGFDRNKPFRKYYNGKIKGFKDLMYIDFHTFLRHVLRMSDLASMYNSVEERTPYLDYRLIEFLYSLDDKFFFFNGEQKYIQKKLAEKYLPKELIYRPKRGFSVPLNQSGGDTSGKIFQQFIFSQFRINYNL